MGFEECVIQTKLFQFCELTFDSIEPRSVCRGPDKHDVVVLRPSAYVRMFVRREIIQDQIDSVAFGIHLPQAFKSSERLLIALSLKEVSPQSITANIIEGQKMANAMRARIGRRQPLWMPLSRPMRAILRTKFQWAKFVEADNMRTIGNNAVQAF
jgi:hypothetical protein